MSVQKIGVIGSINLDLVASGAPLPRPGETVTGAQFAQHPGGKGANQALAARRLGADVSMIGRVGKDAMAEAALALLRADGVDLSGVVVDETAGTGVALIAVSPDGENQISVASGANANLSARDVLALGMCDAVLCQLEVPLAGIIAGLAMERERGLFAVNLAPAIEVPSELLRLADLLIVNEIEAAFYGEALHQGTGMVAVTLGGAGAVLYRAG
ncbi:MAG: ribokinase, partial [Alphaproteobacteria bacterium]|nr:ribokinase [Alphaproteobacteria bacterium]